MIYEIQTFLNFKGASFRTVIAKFT